MSETITWEEDLASRMNPAILTELFREAVPITEHLGYRLLSLDEGHARGILPLTFESANQHGTHAAANMAHAADVTGGVALGSVLRGVPFVGIHPKTTMSAVLWAGSIHMDYLVPSADDLIVSARIEPERFEGIQEAYHAGHLLVEEVAIRLESKGRLIARGRIKFFVTQSDLLKPQASGEQASILFNHRMKSSARLVTALRGMESAQATPLYDDPWSAEASGAQGRLLAERFLAATPQLQSMIAARTRDIDDLVARTPTLEQAVLLGAGFDFRPFRLANLTKARVFEVDLPYMLQERDKLVDALGLAAVERTPVPANLEHDDLGDVLLAHGFEPARETLLVLEGASMYFDEDANARLLRAIRRLMGSPSSRLWIDVVSARVVERRDPRPEITRFLDGMARLGEPFVFGLDDAPDFFAKMNLRVVRTTPSGERLGARASDIHAHYTFFELAAS